MKFAQEIAKMVEKGLDPYRVGIRKSQEDPKTKVVRKEGERFSIAKYMRGAVYGNWDTADLEKSLFVSVNKKLQSGIGPAGGFLIPPEFSQDIVEYLQAKTIVRSLGALIVNIKGDVYQQRTKAGATAAGWIGEGKKKDETAGLSFGKINLVLDKEAYALVKVSNNLLEDASPAADAVIREDLTSSLKLAEDKAMLQGTGGTQPLGLWQNPSVTVLTLGRAVTFDDLYDAMYAIEAADGTYSAWAMHPRLKNTLRQIKDANGNYIYKIGNMEKKEPDNLLGLPVAKTTQISILCTGATSLAGGTDTYAILANWKNYMIGQKAGNPIKLQATDTGGDAFEYDETWFRAILRCDGAPRQPVEFCVIKGIAA